MKKVVEYSLAWLFQQKETGSIFILSKYIIFYSLYFLSSKLTHKHIG